MRRNLVRATGDFGATLIGNQRNMMPAPKQFSAQRKGGHHMSARSASC
jgi:hypothetical protein